MERPSDEVTNRQPSSSSAQVQSTGHDVHINVQALQTLAAQQVLQQAQNPLQSHLPMDQSSMAQLQQQQAAMLQQYQVQLMLQQLNLQPQQPGQGVHLLEQQQLPMPGPQFAQQQLPDTQQPRPSFSRQNAASSKLERLSTAERLAANGSKDASDSKDREPTARFATDSKLVSASAPASVPAKRGSVDSVKSGFESARSQGCSRKGSERKVRKSAFKQSSWMNKKDKDDDDDDEGAEQPENPELSRGTSNVSSDAPKRQTQRLHDTRNSVIAKDHLENISAKETPLVAKLDAIVNDHMEAEKHEVLPWIKTTKADLAFGFVILLNAIIIGVEIDHQLKHGQEADPPLWVYIMQNIFIVVFLAELVLRVRVDGCEFFKRPAGMFDGAIVGTSILDTWIISPLQLGGGGALKGLSVMRVFRLLRLARIARLLRVCKELGKLVSGLVSSLRAVFWVMVLLLVFTYICAMFAAMTLGRSGQPDLEETFGSVGDSLYAHFKVVTLEGWPDMADWAVEISMFWVLYFIFFIVVTSLALVNLVTGVIVEGVMADAFEDSDGQAFQMEKQKFQEVIGELFAMTDIDSSGMLGQKEYEELLQQPAMIEALNIFGISLDIEFDKFFHMMDQDGNGELSLEEFCSNMMRLRGTRSNMHSMLVQYDFFCGKTTVCDSMAELEAEVMSAAQKEKLEFKNKVEEEARKLVSTVLNAGQREDGSSTAAEAEPPSAAIQALGPLLELAEVRSKEAAQAAEKLRQELQAERARVVDLEQRLEISERRRNAKAEQAEIYRNRASKVVKVILHHAASQTGDGSSPEENLEAEGLITPKKKKRSVDAGVQTDERSSKRKTVTVVDREAPSSPKGTRKTNARGNLPKERSESHATSSHGGYAEGSANGGGIQSVLKSFTRRASSAHGQAAAADSSRSYEGEGEEIPGEEVVHSLQNLAVDIQSPLLAREAQRQRRLSTQRRESLLAPQRISAAMERRATTTALASTSLPKHPAQEEDEEEGAHTVPQRRRTEFARRGSEATLQRLKGLAKREKRGETNESMMETVAE